MSDLTAVALRLSGVSVSDGDDRARAERTLLRDVDWEVLTGEHWAVLGPNGAGKTTLLSTVAGRQRPSAGTVTVLGERHGAVGWSDPRLRLGSVEAVPRAFAAGLTALDVVTMRSAGPVALLGQRIDPAEVERARELLALFGCGRVTDQRYSQCSTGERQRILLARALMRDPGLLLLDEPTSSLDLPGREAFLEAMGRLAEARPTVAAVTVTHRLEEVAASTTHALLLRDGAVMAAGPVAEVITEERLTACFDVPLKLSRLADRWTARVA